jgi:ubiquitin
MRIIWSRSSLITHLILAYTGTALPTLRQYHFWKKLMNKLIASVVFVFALIPLAHAQETIGDKAQEVKGEAVQAKNTVGDNIRQAGRDVKSTAKKADRAVRTLCADGRHTIKGAAGCEGHGGVSKKH